jgi:hypothetical protein
MITVFICSLPGTLNFTILNKIFFHVLFLCEFLSCSIYSYKWQPLDFGNTLHILLRKCTIFFFRCYHITTFTNIDEAILFLKLSSGMYSHEHVKQNQNSKKLNPFYNMKIQSVLISCSSYITLLLDITIQREVM